MIKVESKIYINGKRVNLIGERYSTKFYQDYDDTNDTPVWGNTIYVTYFDEVVAEINISNGDNVSIYDDYVVA